MTHSATTKATITMGWARVSACVVAFFLSTGLLAVAQDSPSRSDDVVKVVTYNVQFLPGIAAQANKRKEPRYRAEQIGEKMAAFDIVALNETFENKAREIILDKLRDAWGDDFNVIASPKPEKQYNGGCVIASRLPFLETNSVYYENYSRPKDYGIRADGFAAKGVIHARIKRSKDASDDDFIDVFATHMEARANDLREKQYPELAAFIKKNSDPDHATLLLGDLNTRGHPPYLTDPEAQYARLMGHLKSARSEFIDVWSHLKPAKLGGTSEQESEDIGRRIDYILLANPAAAAHRLTPLDIRVNLHQDPRVVALSDHNAVEADFAWPSR